MLYVHWIHYMQHIPYYIHYIHSVLIWHIVVPNYWALWFYQLRETSNSEITKTKKTRAKQSPRLTWFPSLHLKRRPTVGVPWAPRGGPRDPKPPMGCQVLGAPLGLPSLQGPVDPMGSLGGPRGSQTSERPSSMGSASVIRVLWGGGGGEERPSDAKLFQNWSGMVPKCSQIDFGSPQQMSNNFKQP